MERRAFDAFIVTFAPDDITCAGYALILSHTQTHTKAQPMFVFPRTMALSSLLSNVLCFPCGWCCDIALMLSKC